MLLWELAALEEILRLGSDEAGSLRKLTPV